MELRTFTNEEIARVECVSVVAEELTSDALRVADFASPTFTYDIQTAAAHEDEFAAILPRRALAEVRRVVRFPFGNDRRRDPRFRLVLNDPRILAVADRHPGALDAVLLFVLTHELIHIIRFATFRREFEASRAARRQEESLVNAMTEHVLDRSAVRKSFQGLAGILERFRI
ncbi:MAG: hypothetical protein HYY84_15060 [Deltaproteobacteria bacterium]|nr:hypothetical protein [Deltaproteobacteria bacterium]